MRNPIAIPRRMTSTARPIRRAISVMSGGRPWDIVG